MQEYLVAAQLADVVQDLESQSLGHDLEQLAALLVTEPQELAELVAGQLLPRVLVLVLAT